MVVVFTALARLRELARVRGPNLLSIIHITVLVVKVNKNGSIGCSRVASNTASIVFIGLMVLDSILHIKEWS